MAAQPNGDDMDVSDALASPAMSDIAASSVVANVAVPQFVSAASAINRLQALHNAAGAIPSTISAGEYPRHVVTSFLYTDPIAAPIVIELERAALRITPNAIRTLFAKTQGSTNPLNDVPVSVFGHVTKFMDDQSSLQSLFQEFYAHGGFYGVRDLPADHKRVQNLVRLVDLLETVANRVDPTEVADHVGPVVAWMMKTRVGEALAAAARRGDLPAVRQMLSSRAHVDAIGVDGASAIVSAVQSRNDAMITDLLAANADVNIRGSALNTVLISATLDSNLGLVQALITAKAIVNQQRADGRTALLFASGHGELDIVNALLGAGADVETQNEHGTRAIMNASFNGHLAVVEALFSAKADVNARNNDGKTALDMVDPVLADVVQFLVANGGVLNQVN